MGRKLGATGMPPPTLGGASGGEELLVSHYTAKLEAVAAAQWTPRSPRASRLGGGTGMLPPQTTRGGGGTAVQRSSQSVPNTLSHWPD